MNIEIIRQTPGGLEREVWSFYATLDYGVLCQLQSYRVEVRATTRHRKWHRQKLWSRDDSRYNTLNQPPLPDDVVAEAKGRIIEEIRDLRVTL